MLDARTLVRWSSTDADDKLHRARLEHLLESAAAAKGRIVIPTPVIAEFLVRTNEVTAAWLTALERKAAIRVASFDRRAAVECALLDAAALNKGDKRGGRKDPWQRIKVDRQIVGIARACQADVLITDDAGMSVTARAANITVSGLEDLPIPDAAKQAPLPFGPHEVVMTPIPAVRSDGSAPGVEVGPN